jgi:hypothetical protein
MLVEPNVDSNLRLIASALKRLPTCHACTVEGQQHDCQSITARWLGREILKTLDRPGWTTNNLTSKDA